MKRRIAVALIGSTALAVSALPASAALGVAVVKDPWNIAQTTATVRKLAEQYRTMVEQLAAARAQVGALTSHSGVGELLDGPAERAARRYLPDAWAAATDLRHTAGAVGQAAETTRRLYAVASPQEISPRDPEGAEAQRYARETGAAVAVLTGTEAMLDATAKRRDAYEALMDQIEAAPDAKAAADLANRLAAETGLAQNELVRATAMNAHLLALQEMRLAAATAASARAAVRTRVNLSGGTYAPAS